MTINASIRKLNTNEWNNNTRNHSLVWIGFIKRCLDRLKVRLCKFNNSSLSPFNSGYFYKCSTTLLKHTYKYARAKIMSSSSLFVSGIIPVLFSKVLPKLIFNDADTFFEMSFCEMGVKFLREFIAY